MSESCESKLRWWKFMTMIEVESELNGLVLDYDGLWCFLVFNSVMFNWLMIVCFSVSPCFGKRIFKLLYFLEKYCWLFCIQVQGTQNWFQSLVLLLQYFSESPRFNRLHDFLATTINFARKHRCFATCLLFHTTGRTPLGRQVCRVPRPAMKFEDFVDEKTIEDLKSRKVPKDS